MKTCSRSSPQTASKSLEALQAASEIAERKRTEAALQKTRDELERRIEARTAELTGANERLHLELLEHRHLEEALKKVQEDLEHQVVARTADSLKTIELLMKRVIAERKQAEKALQAAEQELKMQRALVIHSDHLRSLGEMAAGIAHELNQPLTGIRVLAEHFLIGLDRGWNLTEGRIRDCLRMIVEQSDRMSHVIDHIRVFSREAGRPEVRPVQVNDVVRSGMDMLDIQFRSRGVELACDLAEGLPPVSANPFSLEEVVLNLLLNARDAVEERLKEEGGAASPHILIRTRAEGGGEDQRVNMEVIDRGVGIPAEALPKVFDPFFTTKGPDRGTGLGLSVSRSIVEGFGGIIKIQSTPGQGTDVTVSLPAMRRET